VPCLLCWTGRLFSGTAIVLLVIHFLSDKGRDGGPTARTGTTDAEVEKLLRGGNTAEAKAWLSEPNKRRSLPDGGRRSSLQFVNELYARGAVKVTVVGIDIDPDDGEEIGDRLVVELPKEADKRRRIFELINKQADEDEAQKDTGRKYALVPPD
jgi:hypothetical protein